MQPRLLEPGYRFRPPRPSRFWAWALSPLRRRIYRRTYGVRTIEIRGTEHIRAALAGGRGAMVAVNHPAHGDPFVIFEAMSRMQVACCYLAAWQVLRGWWGLKGWAFQRLGAFSVDREGTDMRSFRAAVEVLATSGRSLVIFPEGEVYHLNDSITPLREGAAMIAVTAARRRSRSGGPALHIVPCALKYFYLQDPTPQLQDVMSRLERRLYWRPRVGRPLAERIYRYAEAVLGLKEIEYLQSAGTGPLPDRIQRLSEHVLSELEKRRLDRVSREPVPVRVNRIRARIMKELAGDDQPEPAPEALEALDRDLGDLHLVTQLFSYPGDYVAGQPSLERVTETLDKFEEDALGAVDAGARAPRRAIVSFGPSIDVTEHIGGEKGPARPAAGPLTAILQQRLQEQLDRMSAGAAAPRND